MTDQAWKAAERKVASILGGARKISDKGSNAPDVEHPVLAPEVKHGMQVPVFCEKALEQAKRNAPNGKIPCAVFHRKNSRTYVVLLDLDDFARLLDHA